MHLITNSIDGTYLREILENAPPELELVKAAVAYASSEELLDFCINRKVPCYFWGRMDETLPISIPLLKKFLVAGPNYHCKLIFRHYHPKIIWFVNYGAYIGSANLTQKAWYNNIECGVWFTHQDLCDQGMDVQLTNIFDVIDGKSESLTDELLERLKKFSESTRALDQNASKFRDEFDREIKPFLSKDFRGLAQIPKRNATDTKRREFLHEWNETLQLLRKVSELVSDAANRPTWINASVPKGVQVDQFLHAFYYQKVKVGGRSHFEEFYNTNKSNPQQALDGVLAWWKSLATAPQNEDEMIYQRAPFLREYLGPDKLISLSQEDFINVCVRIHAFVTAARQTSNEELDLPGDTKLELLPRAECVARWLWLRRSKNGSGAREVINHVLYGGPADEIPVRLWNVIDREGDWHLRRFGLSCMGELVGWAMPDKYPPRNGRTSKALRALGFNVKVYSE